MPATVINYINFKILIANALTQFKSHVDKKPLLVQSKYYVATLETCLNMATDGSDLWNAIEKEVDKMPGWWSFFNEIRSLTLALENLLARFPHNELLRADLQEFRNSNNLLKENYTQLEQKYFSLKNKFELLENHDVVSSNEKLQIANAAFKEHIAALEAINVNQKHAINNLEEEVRQMRAANKQLEASNERLLQMYNDLLKHYENFKMDITEQVKILKIGQESQDAQITQLKTQLASYQSNNVPIPQSDNNTVYLQPPRVMRPNSFCL